MISLLMLMLFIVDRIQKMQARDQKARNGYYSSAKEGQKRLVWQFNETSWPVFGRTVDCG